MWGSRECRQNPPNLNKEMCEQISDDERRETGAETQTNCSAILNKPPRASVYDSLSEKTAAAHVEHELVDSGPPAHENKDGRTR